MEPGKEGLTTEQMKVAFSTKDTYGQPLPLPPQNIITEIDVNKDGFISKQEMLDWKGYEGHKFCNTLGDRSYGCSDRCVGGLEKPNGNASYFSYEIEKFQVDDDSDKESTAHYTGGMTRAMQLVLKSAVKDMKKHSVSGEIALVGMKAFYHFRLFHDQLKELGDTTTKIHLYDTFTGMDSCDYSKDTSMCPTAGSSAVDQKGLTDYVAEWSDASRVLVHKVSSYSNIDMPKEVSIALVDGALYKPTKAMLESVAPVLNAKGKLFVHDFGWEGFTGVETASEEVAKAKGMKIKLAGSQMGAACYLGLLEKDGGFFR